MPIEPVNERFQRKARIEAGGAGIASARALPPLGRGGATASDNDVDSAAGEEIGVTGGAVHAAVGASASDDEQPVRTTPAGSTEHIVGSMQPVWFQWSPGTTNN